MFDLFHYMAENDKKANYIEAIKVFSRMSGYIIGPVILGLVVGKTIDARYHTSPRAVIISIIVASVISFIGLIKEAMKYVKTIDTKPKTPTDPSSTFTDNQTHE